MDPAQHDSPWYVGAVLAFLIFAVVGRFASTLVGWLRDRPGAIFGFNVGEE